MRVELLSYTPDALNLLIFTKNTRLSMNAGGLNEVYLWPMEKKMAELEYMRNTIQSSWEFVDYVFGISDVTRAFTHQLVRHRVGVSFAQQAQRVVRMEGFHYLATGEKLNDGLPALMTERDASYRDGWGMAGENPSNVYDRTMQQIDTGYNELLQLGVEPQDARGVLPTNILTNIVMKVNLRALHEMALKRLCVKAQGEFQNVFRAMVEEVAKVHPWAERFLRVQCAWNGTCLFPSLPVEQCPVKPVVFNPIKGEAYGGGKPATLDEIYQIHKTRRAEVQPVIAATDEHPAVYRDGHKLVAGSSAQDEARAFAAIRKEIER